MSKKTYCKKKREKLYCKQSKQNHLVFHLMRPPWGGHTHRREAVPHPKEVGFEHTSQRRDSNPSPGGGGGDATARFLILWVIFLIYLLFFAKSMRKKNYKLKY
uniref:Uncharacterized protein n=1 Tax=Sphaerodactylus townsendi TaxID=933632 RepID=A0ACB8FRV2_9SAUR